MIERMVLFGASGDLTSRLLLPAVAQLAEDALLPDGLALVGSDITDWSTDDFREHIAGKLREHADVTPATRDRVVSMLSFQSAEEMLHGNPMLFIRGDEAEEAWRIIDPVMAAWAAGDVPMQEYAAGTAPPGPVLWRLRNRCSRRVLGNPLGEDDSCGSPDERPDERRPGGSCRGFGCVRVFRFKR